MTSSDALKHPRLNCEQETEEEIEEKKQIGRKRPLASDSLDDRPAKHC
jgi:hypothetical protein